MTGSNFDIFTCTIPENSKVVCTRNSVRNLLMAFHYSNICHSSAPNSGHWLQIQIARALFYQISKNLVQVHRTVSTNIFRISHLLNFFILPIQGVICPLLKQLMGLWL